MGGVETIGVERVELRRELLRETAGVHEDDRRSVGEHGVEDARLDVRPDRAGPLVAGSARVGGGVAAPCSCDVVEVRNGHDDAHVGDPLGGRLHDRDRRRPAEERGDGVERTDRRGQPDPPSGSLEQIVEALQREGEVRPALRACDRVHLVDDDGVDGAQSVSRP